MEKRTAAIVWLVLGPLLLAAGLGAIAWASLPKALVDQPVLLPGPTYLYSSWSVLAGGHIQGTWSAIEGGPALVLVLNGAEYASFIAQVPYDALYAQTANAGTIDLDVPGLGTYYVVFAHGAQSQSSTVYLKTDLVLTGTEPTLFFIGLGVAAVGAYETWVGTRRWRALPHRVQVGAASTSVVGGSPPDDVPAPSPLAPGPPTGGLRVSLRNASGSEKVVRLRVNGVDSTPIRVPAGELRNAGLYVTLPSKFGSTVTVEARAETGESARRDVFVRAYDRTTVDLTLT